MKDVATAEAREGVGVLKRDSRTQNILAPLSALAVSCSTTALPRSDTKCCLHALC